MALQTEIWLDSIILGLFADNTFASKSIDHSGFVDNKTVHVPNAGAGAGVVKNRSSLPAVPGSQEDSDLEYSMNEYTTDPVVIKNAEKVELSYSKREAVISSSRSNLFDKVYSDIVYSWVPTSPNVQATLGGNVASHIATATGNRKLMNKATVKAIKKTFDGQDIPQEGRNILLDSDMYNQLMDDLTDNETNHFLAGANPETGVIGKYMNFNFFMRSKVAKTTAEGVLKAWTATDVETDSAAGIAWHDKVVSRAVGATEFFDNEKRAEYYGDVLSFLVRAGGSCIRYDKKGFVLIYQGTPA